LDQDDRFCHKTCVTGQHKEMLDQVLTIFNIQPDYDMEIFEHGQTLTQITTRTLEGLEQIFKEFKPQILLVQGDTTTVFAGALAAFYHQIKIGHVEAGLRSGNLMSPYPEEGNRKMAGVITHFHFAPTQSAADNLLKESYPPNRIFITGNTVIDALKQVVDKNYVFENRFLNQLDFKYKRIILLTAHRRENIGEPMKRIFTAVKEIVTRHMDVEVVYPVHLNPKVKEIADEVFDHHPRVHLIPPLDYLPFANLLNRCHLVVTDSGGIQEEAPALGKPVLVVREETERPEGISAGTAKLVGTQTEGLYHALTELLNSETAYGQMANAVNPYGDGKAAARIRDVLVKHEMKNNPV